MLHLFQVQQGLEPETFDIVDLFRPRLALLQENLNLVGVLLVECFSKATPACPSTAICDVGEALCPCRFTNCTIHGGGTSATPLKLRVRGAGRLDGQPLPALHQLQEPRVREGAPVPSADINEEALRKALGNGRGLKVLVPHSWHLNSSSRRRVRCALPSGVAATVAATTAACNLTCPIVSASAVTPFPAADTTLVVPGRANLAAPKHVCLCSVLSMGVLVAVLEQVRVTKVVVCVVKHVLPAATAAGMPGHPCTPSLTAANAAAPTAGGMFGLSVLAAPHKGVQLFGRPILRCPEAVCHLAGRRTNLAKGPTPVVGASGSADAAPGGAVNEGLLRRVPSHHLSIHVLRGHLLQDVHAVSQPLPDGRELAHLSAQVRQLSGMFPYLGGHLLISLHQSPMQIKV
mmetsp:Transcript_5470/g.15668  ORF Transcript_5470/g.15668 Transcript_5470/m.15668 type:complete len:403 (-) Transcript_5470:615-1823(-)